MGRKRYFAKARWSSQLDEEVPELPSLTVYERDPDPVPTGLLDADGNALYCTYAMDPIGFVIFED
jgi:hypothetical protein